MTEGQRNSPPPLAGKGAAQVADAYLPALALEVALALGLAVAFLAAVFLVVVFLAVVFFAAVLVFVVFLTAVLFAAGFAALAIVRYLLSNKGLARKIRYGFIQTLGAIRRYLPRIR